MRTVNRRTVSRYLTTFYCSTHRVFLQVGFTGEAQSTPGAVEVPLALVVDGSPVVLQGALVAEGGVANVTVEDVSSVGSQDVPGQTRLAGEGRVTGVTLVRLVSAVGLHVTGQGLLVLELDPALGAGVGLRVVGVVELLVDCQVILPGESLWTVTAGELVVLLVSSLVPPQTVAPLEGLPALVAHVLPVAGVGVHVGG